MSPRLLLLLTAVQAHRPLRLERDASDARLAGARLRLVIDAAFAAWQAAAHDARVAWNVWLASAARDRGDAYAEYRASLDREERAAERLAAAITA
jgi:hypothetical protein